MVKRHPDYLDQCKVFFSCITCHAQIVRQQDIVSRAFQGKVSRSDKYMYENKF